MSNHRRESSSLFSRTKKRTTCPGGSFFAVRETGILSAQHGGLRMSRRAQPFYRITDLSFSESLVITGLSDLHYGIAAFVRIGFLWAAADYFPSRKTVRSAFFDVSVLIVLRCVQRNDKFCSCAVEISDIFSRHLLPKEPAAYCALAA